MSRTALRSSLAALAALAIAAPAATAASRPSVPTARYVLAVAPGFNVTALPPVVVVRQRLDAVHALVVQAPVGAVSWLISLPGVVGVSPDRALHVTGDDSPSSGGVYGPAGIGGGAGKKKAGAGIGVALLDTGVADTAALSRSNGNLVSGPNYSGDTSGTRDGYGHGTFMADLIAGSQVNEHPVGVAPAATVVDVKVAASDGSTNLSNVLSGMDWVAKNAGQVQVLSLSLSATRPQDAFGRDPLTEGADAVRNAGVVVVVSAGNDPTTVGDPGQDPYLMTVGAANTLNDPFTAPFSGHAVVQRLLRPDLVAPGVSILSMLPPKSAIALAHRSAAAGHGLYRGSGTSQATALTAGAVAVFLSKHSGLSPDDVRVSFAKAAQPLNDAAGAGLITIPSSVSLASDNASSGAGGAGSSSDSAGDPSTSASSWSASSWSASSWSASSWSASSWSASSWSASSWSASSWSASSWSASSWSSVEW
ncbi:MAG: S8 family serine peptidase [Actinomycetota bacterium]|nr:S8 family serine peptidase [Actinomycetota bacterium]